MEKPCPFCEISRQRTGPTIVFQNDRIVAFMDIRPIRPGHVLVIPKIHEPDFHRLDNDLLSEMIVTAKQIATALEEAFHPPRVGLLFAGFDIPHAHLHLIPLHDYHDVTSSRLLSGEVHSAESDELIEQASQIRKLLEEIH